MGESFPAEEILFGATVENITTCHKPAHHERGTHKTAYFTGEPPSQRDAFLLRQQIERAPVSDGHSTAS